MPRIILALTCLVALIFSLIAKKYWPEKVNKLIPYNFVVLGSLFCYLSKEDSNDKFHLFAGVGFFVYGIFLLFKRGQLHKTHHK